MKFDIHGAITRLHFDCISDALEDFKAPLKNSTHIGYREGYVNRPRDFKWYGVESGQAVMDALENGYPAGVEKLEAMRASVAADLPRALSYGRKKARGPMGDEYDMLAGRMGALDTAWTSHKRAVKPKTSAIRLFIDIGANAKTSAQALQWRGVAGLTLAQAMQAAGYNVEIVGGFCTSDYFAGGRDNSKVIITFSLAPRGSRIDVASLAPTACLPGFFRTIGFSAILRAAELNGQHVDDALGHIRSLENFIEPDSRIADVIVSGEISSEARAKEWVKKTINLLQQSTMTKEGA